MSDLHCVYCTRPLSGGLDTYGLVGEEQCFDCYLTPEAEVDVFEDECLETIRLTLIEMDAIDDLRMWDLEAGVGTRDRDGGNVRDRVER